MNAQSEGAEKSSEDASRRRFLQNLGMAGAASMVGVRAVGEEVHSKAKGNSIPQRALGRTGVQISALGIGGHHLGGARTSTRRCR